MLLLGTYLESGYHVPQDHAEALEWYRKAVKSFRKAAERGDTEAMNSLGGMFRYRTRRAAGLCRGGEVVSQGGGTR